MRQRLRTFLWKCWYRIWAVIAIGTILVALAFGVARMLFPMVPGYKAEFERLASQALGHNVSIEKITTDWKWFRPRLKLLNVVVHAGDGERQVLKIDQLILAINLLHTALERKLDVDDITLQGASIRVSRDAKGGVTIQDMPVYSPASDLTTDQVSEQLSVASDESAETGDETAADFELKIPTVLRDRTIKLADISIDYSDAILDLHYFAPSVDIALRFLTGKAALYLDVKLPVELGERLEFAIETDGDLEAPKELNGRVFFRGTGLEPVNWKQPVWVAEKIKSGKLDLALWLDIRQPGDIDISGTVKASNVDLVLPVAEGKQAGNWQAEELQLKYHAASDGKNIRAHIKDLQFKRDGREWLPGSISLRTPKDRAIRFKKGELAVDFLRFEDILSSVSGYIPYVQAAQDTGLVSVHGDLDNVYLRWDFTDSQHRILAQGNFKSLALYGEHNIPTVKGVTGSVRVHDNRLAIKLNIETLHIDYPQLFREALPPLSVAGEVQVQRDGQDFKISSRDFHISNPDVEADSWFEYEIDLNENIVLADHYSRFEVFNTASTSRYLPAKRMHGEKGIQWLDNAFISGGAKNGELSLRGPVNKMPFRNGEGVFRVEFDSDNNVLNFWEPGPYATDIRAHAVFDGPSMVIYGYETKILDSVAQDITVRIDDFKDAPLLVSANVYGSADDAWTYIKETELRDIFDVVDDQMSVGGVQAATLEMNIPIHNDDLAPEDRLHSRISIDGGLYDGKVSFSDWKLHFADINSRVAITESSVNAEPFSVLLNEQPVTVHIDTETVKQENIVTAHLQGDIAAGDFLQSIEVPVADFVHGRSLMRAALEMEIGERDDDDRRNPLLRVSGDLHGVGVNLPEPLLKPSGLMAPISITAEFEKSEVITLFRYRDRIGGVIRSEHGEGMPQITYADIKLDAKGLLPMQAVPRGVAQMEPGIFIEGGVEAVNIDAWRDMPWMQGNRAAGIVDRIEAINVFTGKFTYLNRSVDNLQLDIRPELHNWKFQLISDLIKGQVLIPRKGFATRGLSVDLEYFNYDEIHSGAGGKQPVPSDIPPFRIKIDRLRLNDWDLRDAVMLADQAGNAVTLHSLRINDPAVGLVGSGEWSMDDQGNHHSKAKMKFDSRNIGEGLSRFGFANLIEGSTGTAELEIAWDAMPSEFDLAILQGGAKLDFKKGQVLNIEPGGGRILGLLSLQMIPRRLALDFRDLFNEGFAYDDMAGSFLFSDGHAYSSDYRINGPVGRIEINGRIGLVDQDYDQHIKFRPKLSGSLPIIGAIVGGATGGWAMVVMDSMVRIFGGDTDDLIQAHYTVTGSWDDPVITPVKRPKKAGTNVRKRKPENEVNIENE